MTSTGRQTSETRTGISSVPTTGGLPARTAPVRLCFAVEERYDNHVMLGAVVDVLRSWGHQVDVTRPRGGVADRWELLFTASQRYVAFVLTTVSSGPGPGVLDSAAAAGLTTVNDYRAIRQARDKAEHPRRAVHHREALTAQPVRGGRRGGHPGEPQLRELALAVGRVFGGEGAESPQGSVVRDVNGLPGFGPVPGAARLARTVLRVTRRAATAATSSSEIAPVPTLEATA